MEKRWILAFFTCSILAMSLAMAAGCSKREGAQDPAGQAESEAPESEAEEAGQETLEADGDALAGGSAGELVYEVCYEQRQYEADDGTVIFLVKLAYPAFQGTGAAAEAINRFYEGWKAEKLQEYEEDEASTRQTALEVYRESRDAGWPGPWGEEYEVSSVKSHGGYVSVLMDSYLYEGGAHGVPYRESHSFSLQDGGQVTLLQMSARAEAEWNALLRERFTALAQQAEEGDFYEDAPELLQNKALEQFGYYFTDAGIMFYLPPYEISPYSTGYVELLISYEEAGF